MMNSAITRVLNAQNPGKLSRLLRYQTKCFSTQTQPILDPSASDNLDSLNHPDYFQVSNLFTVKDLFQAKVHLGHKEGSMNKNMTQFIFGSRLGHLIIDLDQTAELLREALNFMAHIAFREGIILFFTRDPQSTHLVDKLAKEVGEYAHTRKWKEGIFTNSDMEFKIATRLPDLCVFLNTFEQDLRQHQGIISSAKLCIPTIAIVDSNSNPNLVTYPIPGNDDTPSAVELYCKLFKQAINRGKQARVKLDSAPSIQ